MKDSLELTEIRFLEFSFAEQACGYLSKVKQTNKRL